MKKIHCAVVLCGTVLLLLSFVGCGECVSENSSVVSSDFPVLTDSDSSGTDGTSLVQTFVDRGTLHDVFGAAPLSDEVLFRNSAYVIERSNGFCYLTFSEGHMPEKLVSGGCVIHTGDIYFKSPAALVNGLKTTLDDYCLQQIRTFYSCNEDGKYAIIDPEYFRVPVFPSNVEDRITVWVNESALWYGFYLSEYREGSASGYSRFCFTTKKQYEQSVENFEKFGTDSSVEYEIYKVSDRNATVYDRSTQGGLYRQIRYVLREGDKVLYVTESYRISSSNSLGFTSETVPSEVYVYGTDGEAFFYIYSSAFNERPSVEWLLSIETELYCP